jgi:hypothetical protein
MGSFIDALPISETDKGKLKQLGAETPFSLLSLIEAAPQEFRALMGDTASFVVEQVKQMVPPSQRKMVGSPPEFPLGAELGPSPRIPDLTRDTALRDRLFAEWRSLLNNPATRDSKRAKELEEQLNALLEQ